tara:strand:+ start:2599 stop:3870 length:1272 start_codon:yes stop_codon:yes gene_type:complete
LKKIILILLGLILFFIAIIYFSLWSHPDTGHTDVLVGKQNVETLNFENLDSVSVAAATIYEGALLKEIMQGEQYRAEWAVPVKVPVLLLDRTYGGLTILKKGGGKQTKSLRLKSVKGLVYTLRSVAKDPEPLIPEFAKTLGIENLIIDGITAQHPYGAMVVAKLAEAVHLSHTHPRLVFVPNQEALGKYNEGFGNKLYWLEYETEGEENWSAFENIIAIIDTEELQEQKFKHRDKLHIDTQALVRNRLFDIVIGDWDRHAKQWGWFLQKKNDRYIAIPLASDRDNAFFTIDGLLPSIIASKNVQPRLRPFQEEVDYMPGLVYPFDIYFLKGVSKETFQAQAAYIKTHLTDTAIDHALATWPKEIHQLHGKEIRDILIARRNNLNRYALEFYKVLQSKNFLTQPLKGSDDADVPMELHKCFECL